MLAKCSVVCLVYIYLDTKRKYPDAQLKNLISVHQPQNYFLPLPAPAARLRHLPPPYASSQIYRRPGTTATASNGNPTPPTTNPGPPYSFLPQSLSRPSFGDLFPQAYFLVKWLCPGRIVSPGRPLFLLSAAAAEAGVASKSH